MISKSITKNLTETYYGFENHQGRTFLAEDEKPLGKVVYGNGNNKEDGCEGFITKTSLGATSTVLSCPRNANLAYRLVSTALKINMAGPFPYRLMEEILSLEQPEEYADVKARPC